MHLPARSYLLNHNLFAKGGRGEGGDEGGEYRSKEARLQKSEGTAHDYLLGRSSPSSVMCSITTLDAPQTIVIKR